MMVQIQLADSMSIKGMALSDASVKKTNGHSFSCMHQDGLFELCCIVEKCFIQLERMHIQQCVPFHINHYCMAENKTDN